MVRPELFILCGGLGSRLGAITKKKPKPLLKITGKPFLEHVISYYSNCFDRVNIIASFNSHMFDYLNSEKVRILKEKKLLGTAGYLISYPENFPNSFFLSNGDTFLYPFNVKGAIEEAEKFNSSVIFLCASNLRGKGSVNLTGKSVSSFNEKVSEGKGLAYVGFSKIVKRDVLDLGLKKNIPISLEKVVFPKLSQLGKLSGIKIKTEIYDIGTTKGILKFKSLCSL